MVENMIENKTHRTLSIKTRDKESNNKKPCGLLCLLNGGTTSYLVPFLLFQCIHSQTFFHYSLTHALVIFIFYINIKNSNFYPKTFYTMLLHPVCCY